MKNGKTIDSKRKHATARFPFFVSSISLSIGEGWGEAHNKKGLPMP